MLCAIHQPNFFPWIGYFDKIYRADKFCFLDCVDYPKSSKTMSTWSNRVGICVQETQKWINCPVIREQGRQKIIDVKIDDNQEWRKKIRRTLEYNYKKAPFFEECWEKIRELIDYRTCSLADYNCHVIVKLSEEMGLKGDFYRQSELCTTEASNELLIEIVKKLYCDSYMCGGGAKGYQNDNLFFESNINLIYQNFIQPHYRQAGNFKFVPGLSILDALFCLGFKGVEKMIKERNRGESY